MSTDMGSVGEPNDGRIVGAVDECETGTAYVIADISQDSAWISMDESATLRLSRRR